MYKSVRHIPKSLLENLYVERHWNLREIARFLGCSPDTVVRRMKDYDIPRRPKKKEVEESQLVHFYQDGRASLTELSQRFQVSPSTIANRLRECQIVKKRMRIQSSVEHPEVIKRAYESGNTTTAIANMMGITRWKVLHILRSMGVMIQGKRRHQQPVHEMEYLYKEHALSTRDIGIAYGLRANTVALYLRELGIPLRGQERRIDPLEVKRMRTEGASIREIAQTMDCSTSAVRSRLK